VGHAAGQLPQRLHLLQVQQLVLEAVLAGKQQHSGGADDDLVAGLKHLPPHRNAVDARAVAAAEVLDEELAGVVQAEGGVAAGDVVAGDADGRLGAATDEARGLHPVEPSGVLAHQDGQLCHAVVRLGQRLRGLCHRLDRWHLRCLIVLVLGEHQGLPPERLLSTNCGAA